MYYLLDYLMKHCVRTKAAYVLKQMFSDCGSHCAHAKCCEAGYYQNLKLPISKHQLNRFGFILLCYSFCL